MHKSSNLSNGSRLLISFVLLLVLIISPILSASLLELTISPQYAWAAIPRQVHTLNSPAPGFGATDTTPTN